jgi:hypothetical protein
MISKKARISLAFNSKMRQGNIVPFGRNVGTRIATNPLFSSIDKSDSPELTAALDAYALDLKDAVKSGNEKTSVKNKAKQRVLEVLVKIAKEVDIIANGDETVILAAGFEVTKQPERREQEPGPVTALVVLPTLVEGEVNCKWSKGAHANKTAFEWADEEKPETWHNGNYAGGAKLLITGLPSKKWLRFRARSLGGFNRNSPWCEPVRVFVY